MKQPCWIVFLIFSSLVTAADFGAEEVEFFESKIRPVLAQECYECHNSRGKAKSGLVLDHRQGLLDGGDIGPAVVPGKPEESILLEALRHENDLTMPKAGVKLDPPIVADFEKWIEMGAPDPRDKPPTDEELAADTSWESILETRKNWWSFQPIVRLEGRGEVDDFLDEKIEAAGVEKSGVADVGVVMRRLYFTLTGLPPTLEEVEDFNEAVGRGSAASALRDLTTRLLASRHFGERWARHWMDWVRYAESHGSEGDPRIDNAFLYRNYLIRALNADVPYDQLVREHVAGDLLENPRLSAEVNESAIATAHWRMVFHGFAPTDALDEKVRFTDDQINVFTKAFQGLTVSCARCHDHKFDAISQADYYALFGILGSTRPGRRLIDLPSVLDKNKAELAALKPKIRAAVADDWLGAVDEMVVPAEIDKLLENWQGNFNQWKAAVERRKNRGSEKTGRFWNLGDAGDSEKWFRYGNGLPESAVKAGEFTILADGDLAIGNVFPAGVFSHLLSDKHAARLTSPDVQLDGEYELQVLARGGGNAMVRYVVQNYPRSGTVFKVTSFGAAPKKKKQGGEKVETWKWHVFDLGYWEGDAIHVELATARDAPLLTKPNDRSWFGIREAVLVKKGTAQDFVGPLWGHLDLIFMAVGENAPGSKEDLAALYRTKIGEAITRWKDGDAGDGDALLLDFALGHGSLPNELANFSKAAPLLGKYRELENAIVAPTRVHGLDEWVAADQPLYDRGDHKKPLELVPRRFLDAIDATPYETEKSGRLELAENLLRDDNPFTRRVIVNRIWHHVFGQGIVPTVDNFGRMGEKPSHPELLDFLAVKFSDEFDWSIKKMVEYLVTTEAFSRSSEPGAGAAERDPANRLLSHFPVKRLEAEAVRDALLVAAGRLDRASVSGSVNGGGANRSVYVQVIRNNLDPFLSVYDAPVPFSATGRRSETNVPAQSLTMLNNPFVVTSATQFAAATRGDTDGARIEKMWVTALSRKPTEDEQLAAVDFVKELRARTAEIAGQREKLDAALRDIDAKKRAILKPVREKLEAALAVDNAETEKKGPVDFKPIGHWDFSKGTADHVGEADLELVGTAKIEGGALVVDGDGMAKSKPLGRTLTAKTLEVRVQLDTLGQRGGGAMSVQGVAGEPFDSITFAERRDRRWMAGSSGFRRTEDFGGTDETEADSEPIHFVIAYDADGMIRGYRNGVAYGKAYRAKHVQDFPKGSSQVIFGLRHGRGPARGRTLQGKIFEARLYDRALGEAEIAALGTGKRDFVSPEEVLEKLTAAEKRQIEAFEKRLAELKIEREALGDGLGEDEVWKNLAHSIFNLKEFIYLR